MICVECMGEKNQEETSAIFMNMEDQIPSFCLCQECACNPPNFDSLKSVH